MHPFEEIIESVPNFPKEGIIFKDILPLIKDHLPSVVEEMSKNINFDNIDYVVGIEARGFILGMAIAAIKGKGFIPIRKKGKLPPPVLAEEYALEYGADIIEMKSNNNTSKSNILLVDDVLATGGTLKAAITLCERAQFNIQDISVLMNLKFLNSFDKEGIKVHSVLNYE